MGTPKMDEGIVRGYTDLAANVHTSIAENPAIKFSSDALREEILRARPEEILFVKYTFNSPMTIVAFEKIDRAWFTKKLRA